MLCKHYDIFDVFYLRCAKLKFAREGLQFADEKNFCVQVISRKMGR